MEFWKTDQPGYSKPEAWENMQKVLLDMGMLTQPLELEKAYSNHLLNRSSVLLMEEMSPTRKSAAGEQALIQVRSVSAVFPNGNGGLHALERVTFSVSPQEFVCVLGPSGSGKSTLLRILAGLLLPTSGEVLFHGEPVTGPRRAVGFVFQKANLMPWRTVLQNITLPLELEELPHAQAVAIAREMLELVGLTGFRRFAAARSFRRDGATGSDCQGVGARSGYFAAG